jgi:hypothetical protein
MFLPSDLTDDERSLAQEIEDRMLAELPPGATDLDRQIATNRAAEIAAETINESRFSSDLDSVEGRQNSSEEEELYETLLAEKDAQTTADVAAWREANPAG